MSSSVLTLSGNPDTVFNCSRSLGLQRRMRTSKFLWLPLKREVGTASAAALTQDTETLHDLSFGPPLGLFWTEKTSGPLQVGIERLSSLDNHCRGVHLAKLFLFLLARLCGERNAFQ